MCALLAVVIGVTALVANVASPYFGMLNLILSGAPQGDEIDAAREQTAAMTEIHICSGLALAPGAGESEWSMTGLMT